MYNLYKKGDKLLYRSKNGVKIGTVIGISKDIFSNSNKYYVSNNDSFVERKDIIKKVK